MSGLAFSKAALISSMLAGSVSLPFQPWTVRIVLPSAVVVASVEEQAPSATLATTAPMRATVRERPLGVQDPVAPPG